MSKATDLQAARRQENLAKFYNGRQQAAKNDRDLANVLIDRARAVASAAERDGRPDAWYSLAQALHAWCDSYGT